MKLSSHPHTDTHAGIQAQPSLGARQCGPGAAGGSQGACDTGRHRHRFTCLAASARGPASLSTGSGLWVSARDSTIAMAQNLVPG
jgi:hypothetical protein